MIKKKANLIVIAIIFFVLFIMLFVLSVKKSENYIDKVFAEYPITDLESEIDGVVTNIYHIDPTLSRNDPFKCAITINDSIKMTISAGFELHSQAMIYNIIELGTVVKKKPGSKYLRLLKPQQSDTLKYEFTICDKRGFDLKSDF